LHHELELAHQLDEKKSEERSVGNGCQSKREEDNVNDPNLEYHQSGIMSMVDATSKP
jgi:hypothetical protein